MFQKEIKTIRWYNPKIHNSGLCTVCKQVRIVQVLQKKYCGFRFIKFQVLTFTCLLSDFSEESEDLSPWPLKQPQLFFSSIHSLCQNPNINMQATITIVKCSRQDLLHLYLRFVSTNAFLRQGYSSLAQERAQWLSSGPRSIWRLIRLVTATPSPSSLSTLPPGN